MDTSPSSTIRVAISRRAAQTSAVIVFLLYAILQTTIIRLQAVPAPPLSLSTAGFLVGFLNGVLLTSLTVVSVLLVLDRRTVSA